MHNHDQVHSKEQEYQDDVELFSIARDVDVLLLLLPAQLWGISRPVATEREPWLHRASETCARRRWPCLDHVLVMMYSSMHLLCSRVVRCRCGCIKFTRLIHSLRPAKRHYRDRARLAVTCCVQRQCLLANWDATHPIYTSTLYLRCSTHFSPTTGTNRRLS